MILLQEANLRSIGTLCELAVQPLLGIGPGLVPVLLRTCRECQQVSGGVGQQFGRGREALGELVHDPGVYHSVVDWSETPRPHRSRETQFVVFNGSPGAAALSGLARLAAARGDHTTAQKLQARAATVAARDGAPPHTLQTAATTT